jgi:hypothetical protein
MMFISWISDITNKEAEVGENSSSLLPRKFQ